VQLLFAGRLALRTVQENSLSALARSTSRRFTTVTAAIAVVVLIIFVVLALPARRSTGTAPRATTPEVVSPTARTDRRLDSLEKRLARLERPAPLVAAPPADDEVQACSDLVFAGIDCSYRLQDDAAAATPAPPPARSHADADFPVRRAQYQAPAPRFVICCSLQGMYLDSPLVHRSGPSSWNRVAAFRVNSVRCSLSYVFKKRLSMLPRLSSCFSDCIHLTIALKSVSESRAVRIALFVDAMPGPERDVQLPALASVRAVAQGLGGRRVLGHGARASIQAATSNCADSIRWFRCCVLQGYPSGGLLQKSPMVGVQHMMEQPEDSIYVDIGCNMVRFL
jgi:hypothetical protein